MGQDLRSARLRHEGGEAVVAVQRPGQRPGVALQQAAGALAEGAGVPRGRQVGQGRGQAVAVLHGEVVGQGRGRQRRGRAVQGDQEVEHRQALAPVGVGAPGVHLALHPRIQRQRVAAVHRPEDVAGGGGARCGHEAEPGVGQRPGGGQGGRQAPPRLARRVVEAAALGVEVVDGDEPGAARLGPPVVAAEPHGLVVERARLQRPAVAQGGGDPGVAQALRPAEHRGVGPGWRRSARAAAPRSSIPASSGTGLVRRNARARSATAGLSASRPPP